MARLTQAQRERLPKSDFACPGNYPYPGSYPIHNPSHVANARTRTKMFGQKCKGQKARICARARKFGMLKLGYPKSKGWREWCGK